MQNQSSEKPALTFHPLTPELMDDFGAVLRGNFGVGCWCMFPRLIQKQTPELPERVQSAGDDGRRWRSWPGGTAPRPAGV